MGLFNSIKNKATEELKKKILPVEEEKRRANINFIVKGINEKCSDGKNRQKMLGNFLKKQYTFKKPYNGLSNSKIADNPIDVYEYAQITKTDGITLMPIQTTNNDNAIQVVHDKLGSIGFAPDKDYERIVKFINNNDYEIHYNVYGGPHKYYNPEKDKVVTENKKYGMTIKLYKK